MYTITAQIINAFSVPASDKYPESWKLQLMGDTHTRDGQIKKEMITLSIPQGEFNKLKSMNGQEVTLPISFFVKNNQLNPFYPKTAAQAPAAPDRGRG